MSGKVGNTGRTSSMQGCTGHSKEFGWYRKCINYLLSLFNPHSSVEASNQSVSPNVFSCGSELWNTCMGQVPLWVSRAAEMRSLARPVATWLEQRDALLRWLIVYLLIKNSVLIGCWLQASVACYMNLSRDFLEYCQDKQLAFPK